MGRYSKGGRKVPGDETVKTILRFLPAVLVALGAVLAISGGWALVVGTGMSAVGGLWAFVRSERQSDEGKDERLQYEQELRKKSDEITALTERVLSTTTGGTGFCWLSPTNVQGDSMLIAFCHKGEFPLYDLTAEMIDHAALVLTEQEQLENRFDRNRLKNATQVFKVGTLPTGHASGLTPLRLPPDKDRVGFVVRFVARNGSWHQQLYMRRVQGRWVYATRVYRGLDAAVIYERVIAEFPRDDTGNVQWS